MPRFFADLHAHPSLFGFNRWRNSDVESNPDLFHPWNAPRSDRKKMDQGARATTYSQTSFEQMKQGNVRLMFASITPIEVGFFRGDVVQDNESSFVLESIKLATGTTAVTGLISWLRRGKDKALHDLTGILRNGGPLRIALQVMILRYRPERIRFMLSPSYDYWEEFLLEYGYLKGGDGMRSTVSTESQMEVDTAYHLVRDRDQLAEILDESDDIAVVLTIEGAHVFAIGPDQKRLPVPTILQRIAALKELPHPILFITIAHHFDNGFCGHAHSIPDLVSNLINQRERMNAGFEKEDDLGLSIVRNMLELDEELRDQGGRRILIDCKHMSPRARREYYDEIVRPCMNRKKRRGKVDRPVPVVFSHAAYTGVNTIATLIRDEALETDQWHAGPFSAWGLNGCDEDVRMVFETSGLWGICFDQRIAGIGPHHRIPAERLPDVLLGQILGFVDVVMLDDRIAEKAKRRIWDCVCLGTDFDGVIDPISCYPTAASLPTFASDLRDRLEQVSHTRMIDEIGVDEILEKISWRNVHEFTLRHLDGAA
jgi:hypothetical protein